MTESARGLVHTFFVYQQSIDVAAILSKKIRKELLSRLGPDPSPSTGYQVSETTPSL
jgi:hypothetical protein